MMMRVPAPDMGDSKPLRVNTQFAIVLGPDHQMPVAGQSHVSQQPHRRTLPRLPQHFLEGCVVSGFAEKRGLSDRSVEDVVDVASIRASRPSCHTADTNRGMTTSQEKPNLTPFSSSE